MRNRLLELIGPELMMDVPELERPRASEPTGPSSFYINPDAEFAFPFPEYEQLISPKGPPAQPSPPKGHRPIPGGATEILESANTRPARPPRRLFRVDVTESEGEYILRADLAGMCKDNVKIDVSEEQNIVAISVEPPKTQFFGLYKSALESRPEAIKEIEESAAVTTTTTTTTSPEESKTTIHGEGVKAMPEKETCHLIERCTGPMCRSIKMPNAVNMAAAKACMKDGLLVITFAKKQPSSEESKKVSIEIE